MASEKGDATVFRVDPAEVKELARNKHTGPIVFVGLSTSSNLVGWERNVMERRNVPQITPA
jgi:hypothetical protein